MIYARSPALDDLGLVVLDEVHFLQDAYRGPVWEEVIIHLPAPIRLVCLSATVSNADELADVDRDGARPDRRRWSRRAARYASTTTTSSATAPTTSCTSCRRSSAASPTRTRRRSMLRRCVGGATADVRRGGAASACSTPRVGWRRSSCSAGADLLPAIYFIFSRNQCEEAARQRRRCRTAADRRRRSATRSARSSTSGSPDSTTTDLAVLGYDELAAQLDAGVAPHHAGMVPAFKEASSSASPPGCSVPCSPPRRSPSASTCRPGPSSSRS